MPSLHIVYSFGKLSDLNKTIIQEYKTFIQGGLKAVVWTDTWQIVVMFISVIVIITLGTVNIGGYGYVWSKSYEGGRINFFNLNPSLYERQTLLSVIVGGFFYWTSFNSVNQTMVQRYLSLPSITQSKL